MKKTLMTFVAVGFGVSVAFAQTTPTQEDQTTIQTEQTTEIQEAQQDRRQVEMSELPLAVQESFTNGEYSEWQVLAIYETSSESAEGPVYEFELAQAGEAYGEGESDELAGIEKERVSERQPDLILALDANGEILEEKDPDEAKLDEEKLEK